MVSVNQAQLVELSVIGEIASPSLKLNYRIDPVSGKGVILPSVGGISYNANIGDPCMGLAADHIEPGVSIRHPDPSANMALNTFACIGNRATVVSGRGAGLQGWVTGKHGGVNHVMIYFSNLSDLDQLTIGDKFQIRAKGCGLASPDLPELTILNLDPAVFSAIAQNNLSGGVLHCPVTHWVPAHLLGAGLGEDSCYLGDVDIQMFDPAIVAQYGLETLRFGDLIAMVDCDHRYGRIYRPNWVSIGVVTHSCCVQAGHGPGVTTILTGPKSVLDFKQDITANLKRFLPI